MVIRLFVTLSVFLQFVVAVNYFAHAHAEYTRPPFSSQPGIKANVYNHMNLYSL